MLFSVFLLLCSASYGLTVSTGSKCPTGCVKQFDAAGKQSCNCCQQTSTPTDPCKGQTCKTGETCITKEASCNNAFGLHCKQSLAAECKVSCENPTCDSSCQEVYDMNGCKQCLCNKGKNTQCDGANGCPEDTECYIECMNVNDCQPVAMCRSKCDEVDCPSGCSQFLDVGGCPACSCCNACLNQKCEANEECVLVPRDFAVGEPIKPECRPIS